MSSRRLAERRRPRPPRGLRQNFRFYGAVTCSSTANGTRNRHRLPAGRPVDDHRNLPVRSSRERGHSARLLSRHAVRLQSLPSIKGEQIASFLAMNPTADPGVSTANAGEAGDGFAVGRGAVYCAEKSGIPAKDPAARPAFWQALASAASDMSAWSRDLHAVPRQGSARPRSKRSSRCGTTT